MTTILTKKKDTAGAPAPGDLTNSAGGAELAVNTATKRLYTKDSGGNVVEIGTNPSDITAASITDTGLTSGRVTYATTGGLLTDSANLTFNGTTLTTNTLNLTNALTTAYGGTGLTSYTAGDLPYYASGTALSKLGIGTSNQVLTSSGSAPQWSTNLSIGSLTASSDSSFTSTGALTISKGTTAQQPGSPVTGMLRYNTTTNQFEGYSGASPAWTSVGGATISNDTSTASNLYPLFASATSGTALTINTSNAKLLYKPSTGEFTSSVLTAGNGIVVNSLTVATSYTIAAGYSGMSAGPITVASGAVVTVSSGSRWVVQ